VAADQVLAETWDGHDNHVAHKRFVLREATETQTPRTKRMCDRRKGEALHTVTRHKRVARLDKHPARVGAISKHP